ncbi:DUF6838 family protein [Solibacillus silvestris]
MIIDFSQIKIAVNNFLKEKFPEIPVKAQDITKGFERPSFSTVIEQPILITTENQLETSCTVVVYFFPEYEDNEKSLNVLDMEWKMPLLFGNKLLVANRALNINEPSANVVDGILVFQFEILFYQASDSQFSSHNPNAELMQELDFNYKRK